MNAAGPPTLQFSRDIVPVLVENCFGCHSGPESKGMFSMDRFADLLRGGQSGPPGYRSAGVWFLIKKLEPAPH